MMNKKHYWAMTLLLGIGFFLVWSVASAAEGPPDGVPPNRCVAECVAKLTADPPPDSKAVEALRVCVFRCISRDE